MRTRLLTVAVTMAAVVVGVAGCGSAQTTSRRAARLTIDGATHTTRPPACRQDQMYRTITIPDRDGGVEAVVLLSGQRVMPQWVKIRNIDGFTGSFWQGGVGDARVDLANDAYTITGSAYGISASNPNKVVTTDFKIVAQC
ncbi:lipoprotein LpqH [Mycobacterium sp. 94-17]|uniref:lipoprotein LpqH n=1 Tax=Mycobacterium sp. 94-17 TaxID=2986147 RepID=UPI002D1EA0F0|nr:lipoprotein LpqH [Mycobacterium sp. 94-17]MEB4209935.1 lipoprotein LpqH [Mycobacterium sp. 94-17]